MNFQQLRFVVAVADTRSFTSAADLCCVTQPALSNAISQLEVEMGGKLFERTTRSVELTAFGETVMDDIRSILSAKTRLLVDSSEYLAREDRNIRIGMSPLINDDFVAALLSRIGGLQGNLNIILSEMNKADIQPALAAGNIALAPGLGRKTRSHLSPFIVNRCCAFQMCQTGPRHRRTRWHLFQKSKFCLSATIAVCQLRCGPCLKITRLCWTSMRAKR